MKFQAKQSHNKTKALLFLNDSILKSKSLLLALISTPKYNLSQVMTVDIFAFAIHRVSILTFPIKIKDARINLLIF